MTRRRHIIAGLYWGYPVCCILRWVFGRHGRQAEERGMRYVADPPGATSHGLSNSHVKCGVFHR